RFLAASRYRAPARKSGRRARSGTIPLCDAFADMQTGREFAQGSGGASGGGVFATLLGAIICLTATGAWARGPWKFATSQLEPIKRSELAGWTADDHLAAFAAYQTSCRAVLKTRHTDERAELSAALSNVCRKAANLRPQDTETARAFFEHNFQ